MTSLFKILLTRDRTIMEEKMCSRISDSVSFNDGMNE